MTPNPLPDGWGHGRLDSVGTVHTGGTPPTAIRAYYGRDKLFVTPADLGDSKYVVRTTRGLSAAGFARSRRFPAGSVLVVCIGSTIGKVGLAAEELTANQQINAVVPDDQVDPEYLYYAVLTIASAIRERAGEQAVPLVNKSEFSTFAIPVPARAEQQRIATALADADALIHTHRRLIQKKHAVRKGIEQALLGGRTRLAGFSGAWRGVRLGDLLAFKNGLNKSKEFFGVGIPIVNFMDVLRNPVMTRQTLSGRVRLSHEEITRFSARKGDLFFTRTSESVDEVGTASVLNEHVDDAVFSGFVLRGRPLTRDLDPVFLAHRLRRSDVRDQITAKATYTTRALTNGGALSGVRLTLPRHDEQKQIAAALLDIDRDLVQASRHLRKLVDIKNGMLQELLTGRTRLRSMEKVG